MHLFDVNLLSNIRSVLQAFSKWFQRILYQTPWGIVVHFAFFFFFENDWQFEILKIPSLVRRFQESVWDGAVGLWKPVGEAGDGRMESRMPSKCVRKRSHVESVLAIVRWISSAAQDVRYYRRSLQRCDELIMVLSCIVAVCSTEQHCRLLSQQHKEGTHDPDKEDASAFTFRTAGSADGPALRKTLALWLFSVAEWNSEISKGSEWTGVQRLNIWIKTNRSNR